MICVYAKPKERVKTMARISYIFRDDEGHEMSVPLYSLNTVDTVAGAQALAATFVLAKGGASQSEIVRAVVEFDLPVIDADVVEAGSRNDAGATLTFRTGANRKHSIYIPAFPASLIINGVVDINNAETTDLAAAIMASYLTPYGDTLVELIGGKQTVRKL